MLGISLANLISEPTSVRGEPCQKCGMAQRKPMTSSLMSSSQGRIMNGTETEVSDDGIFFLTPG